MSDDFEPKIYVACLAAYNANILHGCWITVNDDVDEIHQAAQNMLAESPITNAEEWAIHDSEGFGKLTIAESENFSSVCEKAEFVREYGELGAEVAANYHGDLKYAKDTLEDYYHGEWDSELDYSTQLFDDTHEVPEDIQNYIDYKAFCYDIFIDGHFSIKLDGVVHVFSEH